MVKYIFIFVDLIFTFYFNIENFILFPFLFCSIYIHLIFYYYHNYFHHSLALISILIFFYFKFTNLIWSVYSFSLSIDFVYFSACYKHWESSSFLSIIKMFLIDLILYFFRYFYFAHLGYFLLVSLFNRMIKNLISKLFIKSRE